MRQIKISPSKLSGRIVVPPSKSLLHRAIIAASLAKGNSIVSNISLSNDINATMDAMKAFGADYSISNNNAKISGFAKYSNSISINVNESGSTLRFLIPLLLHFSDNSLIYGTKRLLERPLEPYLEIFDKLSISYKQNLDCLELSGKLKPSDYFLSGDISSQFITGLLFTLPLLDGNSTITMKSALESKGYVDLTISVLNKFGITIINNNYDSFIITGNQHYTPFDYEVEGDFSQAAFFLVAGALSNNIKCNYLNINSLQGDHAILDILKMCGANLTFDGDTISCNSSDLKAISIDCSQIPDLVPILAVLLSFCVGESKITNVKRLRYKESDRLAAITMELNKIGGNIVEFDDMLVINGIESFCGGYVSSHNDHRIAMSLAIASTRSKSDIIIDDGNCVNKSMVNFWDEFIKLGGTIYE